MTTYSYDATQQTGKEVVEGSETTTTTYAYNLMGRMARVVTTDPDGSTSTVSYEYDAGGTRTRQAVDDGTTVTTTEYLTDHRNATGYSQTLVETTTVGGIETRRISYVIGHDQISQTVTEAGATATHTFHADGKGTTTVLTDAAAAVLQLYLYDAYGNLLNMEAEAALTGYLYNGEYFDASIGQQYLRARWYNPQTGGFNRLDPFFGNHSDPQSFHKYLYTHAGPVNGTDPTGLFISAIGSLGAAVGTAELFSLHTPTVVTGAVTGLSLQTLGRAGLTIRGAGISRVAAGDLTGGYDLYELGGDIFGATASLVDAFDTSIGVASLAQLGFSFAKLSVGAIRLLRRGRGFSRAVAASTSGINGLLRRSRTTNTSSSLTSLGLEHKAFALIRKFAKENNIPELLDNLDSATVYIDPSLGHKFDAAWGPWGGVSGAYESSLNTLMSFSDFVPASGKIAIKVNPAVMQNELLAVTSVAHELMEIGMVRNLLSNGPKLGVDIFDQLLTAPLGSGKGGGIHRMGEAAQLDFADWIQANSPFSFTN